MPSTSENAKTNWNDYYKKTPFFARFTRKTTEKILLHYLNYSLNNSTIRSICELGGANSCFFPAIRKRYPEVLYTIIDNNIKGIENFKAEHSNDPYIRAELSDILLDDFTEAHDVVFSVGLIEHFSLTDMKTIIRKHFSQAKTGALVIITFPTPTWLYSVIRYLSELTNKWIFFDERPLTIQQVVEQVELHGDVITSFINWGTLLTQGVVIARA